MFFGLWRGRFFLLSLVAVGFVGRPAMAAEGVAADAEEGEGQAAVSAVRLGVGCGLALSLTEVEERGGDLVELTQTGYLDLSFAPSYQLAGRWALGPRVSWGLEAGDRGIASSDGGEVDIDRHLWQLAAEGRYQPGVQRGVYAAANLGIAGAMDRMGGASAWQWAPLVGGALGYDGQVTGPLSLGIELRGSFAAFDSEGARLTRGNESKRYVYGQSAFVGVHLTGSFGL
jgi:hypothetical protein